MHLLISFQYQPKKTEEVDSESDWDSLPGDVPEPSSSPDITPRHQPAPPPDSPKGYVPQKRPQIKTQAATATPEKSSAANSPTTQSRAKQETATSQRASQLYGKPGITNFVDRSITSGTAFSDSGLENRQNKELNPDINENRLKQGSQSRRQDGIHIEMNEVDYHQRNPPFTDFQGMTTLVYRMYLTFSFKVLSRNIQCTLHCNRATYYTCLSEYSTNEHTTLEGSDLIRNNQRFFIVLKYNKIALHCSLLHIYFHS